MKKIGISGSSGFLGKWLIKRLQRDFDLVLLTRNNQNFKNLKNSFPNISVKIIDWNSVDNIEENLKDVEILIHAGAMLPTRASANDKEIINSSLNIVENINKSKIKLGKLIFISTLRTCISSNEEYFSDNSEYNFFKYDTQYGRSKFLTEKFLKNNYNFPLIICSPAHIIGPESVEIAKSNDVIFKMFNKKILFITKAKYSIVHISDVCECIYKIIQLDISMGKYLIANQNPTLEEIANIVEEVDGIKKIKIIIPLFIINIMSLFFEMLNRIFNLKNIPLNRSTYHFIKLFKDFKGIRVNELNITFKNTKEMIKEIYEFQNTKGQ